MKQQNFHYSLFEIIQHWVLVLMVAFLALTGFVQAQPFGSISKFTINIFGNLYNLITAHRIAGVTYSILFLFHFIQMVINYIKGRRGLMPKLHDLNELKGSEYTGRFSLRHKLDYLAVFFGSIILIISGFAMLFPEFLSTIFPSQIISIFREIHFNEAIIATSVIIFWHLYYAHFHPDVFPLNMRMFKKK